MNKKKRKFTAKEKAKRKQRQKEYMTIFINGKQKRVKRPQETDRLSFDENFLRNADPIWLQQNELWEYFQEEGNQLIISEIPPKR